MSFVFSGSDGSLLAGSLANIELGVVNGTIIRGDHYNLEPGATDESQNVSQPAVLQS